MIKEKAYAKINLYLNVLSKREDGYHDLEMVMAPIALFDTLSFSKLKTNEIIIESTVKITTKKEENLVYKVAKYLQKEFEIKQGVKIVIDKKIPLAAGLAGGSADAAATLRGLNKLWGLSLSLDDLAKIGFMFGSDIPFCVYNKLSIATSRGEDLLFINKKLKQHVLLINPNVRISTKEVFMKLKKEDIKKHKVSDMTAGIYNGNYELIKRELYNCLEPIAFAIEPKIKEIKHRIKEYGVHSVLMSGSGATIFVLSKDKKKLLEIKEMFNEYYFKKLTKLI